MENEIRTETVWRPETPETLKAYVFIDGEELDFSDDDTVKIPTERFSSLPLIDLKDAPYYFELIKEEAGGFHSEHIQTIIDLDENWVEVRIVVTGPSDRFPYTDKFDNFAYIAALKKIIREDSRLKTDYFYDSPLLLDYAVKIEGKFLGDVISQLESLIKELEEQVIQLLGWKILKVV